MGISCKLDDSCAVSLAFSPGLCFVDHLKDGRELVTKESRPRCTNRKWTEVIVKCEAENHTLSAACQIPESVPTTFSSLAFPFSVFAILILKPK